MAGKSQFPPIKPLPGKKADFPHVKNRVDCRRVVVKCATNTSISPTVTESTTIAAKIGFRSRLPVRIPATVVSQTKPTIPLDHCLASNHQPSKIPLRIGRLGHVARPGTSHGQSPESQVILPVLFSSEAAAFWDLMVKWASTMDKPDDDELFDESEIVLDPIEEEELSEFEHLENFIRQVELDVQSLPVPVVQVKSYRRLKRKRYTRPKLATIAEESVDEIE